MSFNRLLRLSRSNIHGRYLGASQGLKASYSGSPSVFACGSPSRLPAGSSFGTSGMSIRSLSVWPLSGKPDDDESLSASSMDKVLATPPTEFSTNGTESSAAPSADVVASLPDGIPDVSNVIADSQQILSISDLGYMPTDLITRLLDVAHTTTGLPWWATIVSCAVAVRVATLPLTVMNLKNSVRMKKAKPEIEHLQEKIKSDDAKYDPKIMQDYRDEIKKVYKKHQVSLAKPFLGVLQIPIFLGFFWAVPNIGNYSPEFHEEGLYWFKDLAASDPYTALPVVSAVTMLGAIELGGEGMDPEMKEKMVKVFRIAAVASVVVTYQFSSGLFVYWITNNMVSMGQSVAFRVPAIKNFLGIPDDTILLKSAVAGPELSPFQSALSNLKSEERPAASVKTFKHRPNKGARKKRN